MPEQAIVNDSDPKWRQAAVFGALWGSLEVTLGAFLHSLRMPGTGTILTICSAALMVAARQLFHERGFALRAALVCAVLKSFSPGGIIFGPMCAILGEGLMIETAYLLVRKPYPAALIAGWFAGLWTLGQFIVLRLALYGTTIFELYVALLQKGAKAFALPESWGWPALILFWALLSLTGIFGGWIGYKLGQAVLESRKQGAQTP